MDFFGWLLVLKSLFPRSEIPEINDHMNNNSINAKAPSQKLYHLTLNLISTSHLITTMANTQFFWGFLKHCTTDYQSEHRIRGTQLINI